MWRDDLVDGMTGALVKDELAVGGKVSTRTVEPLSVFPRCWKRSKPANSLSGSIARSSSKCCHGWHTIRRKGRLFGGRRLVRSGCSARPIADHVRADLKLLSDPDRLGDSLIGLFAMAREIMQRERE